MNFGSVTHKAVAFSSQIMASAPRSAGNLKQKDVQMNPAPFYAGDRLELTTHSPAQFFNRFVQTPDLKMHVDHFISTVFRHPYESMRVFFKSMIAKFVNLIHRDADKAVSNKAPSFSFFA